MAEVVTFVGYQPPARYDGKPWTQARIQESATVAGTYTTLETVALSPVDSDPANPAVRSFTTELGTALNYWYRIVFVDATGDISQPSAPIQNTAALADTYVTVQELKTALSLGSETYADADLSASAEAASRAVDGITGTRFYPGTAGEIRWYTPVSEEYLLIDDATAVTAVSANGTPLTVGTAYAQIGTSVISVLRSLYGYRFPRGTTNGVAVTGTFGWPAPPADVKRAALILASRIFKRSREAPFGTIGFGIDGGAVVMPGRDPDVIQLLKPYTRSSMIE